MKRLILRTVVPALAGLVLTLTCQAQTDAVLQKKSDRTILRDLATGPHTIKISATGTLEFVSGFTLTGASHLRSALGLGTAALVDTGTASGNVPLISDATLLGPTVGQFSRASDPDQHGLLYYGGLEWNDVDNSGFSHSILLSAPTANRSHTLPNRSGTLLHADGNGSALTGLSPYQLAQVSASDGQALLWSTSNSRWQPGTISSGLTINTTTTTSGASAGDILTSDGSLLQKLTPGTGVATWLGTPSKANLNAAVSDDDPAYVGTANPFTQTQTVTKASATVSAPHFKAVGYGVNFSVYDDDGTTLRTYIGQGDVITTAAFKQINANYSLGDPGYPGLAFDSAQLIAWSSHPSLFWSGTRDLTLARGAAGVLHQKAGTQAQEFQVYGSYTDASNYVRASVSSSSSAVTIAAQTAGTGADDVSINLVPAGAGGVVIGTRGSSISAVATVVKAAHDCASIAAGGTETTTATITGAAAGGTFIPSPISHEGLVISAARTGADTITITFYNPTAGAIDASAVDVRVTEVAF